MAISVTCGCGAAYNFKDEYIGQTVQCPSCSQSFAVQAASPVAPMAQADAAFDRDKFLLRQKLMTINQKYHVSDEQNTPIVFVERPAHLFRTIVAVLAAILVFAVIMAGAIAALAVLLPDGGRGGGGDIAGMIIILGGLLLAAVAAVAVAVSLSPLRHISFYRDETRGWKLLEVLQDKRFQPINATYTLRDGEGNVLARFRKNYLYNFFRKRWYCYDPDGNPLLIAMEDSMILSLLRRFLGPMYGLLRTNFIITPPDSEQVIGEFNRKFTLFDRYVLDLSADPQRRLDRRVALALGVMLDTGERR